MTRYTASNPHPAGTPGHEFIGWDDINGRSTEATRPEHLGILMGRSLKAQFRKLKAGQRIEVPTGSIFREF
jgi:hypothetical protein